MRYALLPFFLLFLVAGCATDRELQMDPEIDLTSLPAEAQSWLCDFEDICISVADNKSFNEAKQLEADINRAINLLAELDTDNPHSWYSMLDKTQRDRMQSLIIGIAVHYGVKGLLKI